MQMLRAMQQIGRKTLVRLLAQTGDSAATENNSFYFFIAFFICSEGGLHSEQRHNHFNVYAVDIVSSSFYSAKDGGLRRQSKL